MRLEILASSLTLALVLLPLLAWKWRINLKTAIMSGIVVGALTALGVTWIDSLFAGLELAVLLLLEFCLVLGIPLLAILLRFYRDPERFPGETGNVILSPADGTVIYVNRVEKGTDLVSTKGKRRFRLNEIMATDLLTDAAYLVGIDMNLLNVHVNRSPIAGQTIFQRRTEGSFISLRRPESETVNERVTTLIGNGTLRVGVIQIASRLVRRIVSYVREGDSLELGQRIGAIVFGSQVDVAIPGVENLSIAVRPGDEVKAGVSVIARYGVPAGTSEP